MNRYKHSLRYAGTVVFRFMVLRLVHLRNHKVSQGTYCVGEADADSGDSDPEL